QWTAGHTGGAPGVATNLEWFPGTDWIMVDLGNYDGDGTRLVDGMARTLITQSARQ
ncbi:MAG: serine hydrolase, partial [Streptomycetaceae bacterium]|nr:serine hydrolase [Streptomycetaceae bacterium]